jgi:pyridoxal phosphate enzyme (YggS family)
MDRDDKEGEQMLKENYQKVIENISAACKKAGRETGSVTLIAVSKTKPAEDIQEIYDAGQREFGENKVQELTAKEPVLPQDIKWHLIGHLQTNKVKYIADKVEMIHSVDSLKLAETISKEAVKHGTEVKILIEVNVAEEESKFGVKVNEALPLITQAALLPGIHICGLMTIAPFVDDPEENRPVFRKLKQLSVDIASKNIDNVSMSVLSMGMTNDYMIAVEEGATHIRVGTAIFGERQYNIRES